MRTEIETAVIEILARQLLLQPGDIPADAATDTLGLDSLGKVEAIFALEERFDISVPFNANTPEQSEFDFSTIPAIVDGIAVLVAQKSA